MTHRNRMISVEVTDPGSGYRVESLRGSRWDTRPGSPAYSGTLVVYAWRRNADGAWEESEVARYQQHAWRSILFNGSLA